MMHITHLLCVSTIMGTPVLAADIWYHISLLHPNTIACNELQFLLLPLWEHPYHLYIEHGKSSVCTTRPHKHTCTYVSVCLALKNNFCYHLSLFCSFNMFPRIVVLVMFTTGTPLISVYHKY